MSVISILGPAVLVGAAGGALWAWLAEPANWQVVGGRIVMTEFSSLDEFPVLLWFVAIGLVLSFGYALVGQFVLKADWARAAWLVVGAVVASLIAWRLGIVLGPDDPRGVAATLTEGDTVPDQLSLNSIVPFIAWPIGALAGILLASSFERDSETGSQNFAIGATTASVNDAKS